MEYKTLLTAYKACKDRNRYFTEKHGEEIRSLRRGLRDADERFDKQQQLITLLVSNKFEEIIEENHNLKTYVKELVQSGDV